MIIEEDVLTVCESLGIRSTDDMVEYVLSCYVEEDRDELWFDVVEDLIHRYLNYSEE